MKRGGTLRPGEGIVLVGPRGAGKSAVSQILAWELDWPLFSTDQMIFQRTGMRTEIQISRYGWKDFRNYEADAVRYACLPGPRVVDTGGGAGLRAENRDWIRKHRVIFLDVDLDTAVRRMELEYGVKRPVLRAGHLPRFDWEAMIKERFWVYQNMADLQLESSQRAPRALTRTILDLVFPLGSELTHPRDPH